MLTVKEVMTQPVVIIRHSATVEQAIGLMRAKQVRSLLVEKSSVDGPCGVLTEEDIVYKVMATGKKNAFVRVDNIMRQPCIRVSANATLQDAAKVLSNAGIYSVPVIENNRLQGTISIADIFNEGHPFNLSAAEFSMS